MMKKKYDKQYIESTNKKIWEVLNDKKNMTIGRRFVSQRKMQFKQRPILLDVPLMKKYIIFTASSVRCFIKNWII